MGHSSPSAPASPAEPRLWTWLGIGAAVASVSVIALAVLLRAPGGDVAAPPEPTAPDPPAAASTAATAEYAKTRADLLAVLERRRSDLPAETLATVMDNLTIIDRAIVELAQALEKDPGNVRLSRLLTAAYQREIDLLRRAATMP